MKDYELDKQIGKRLAECMKYAKINGSALAQEANKYYSMHNLASTKNMSQQKISTIVNGRVHLKKEDAELFAKILNVNLDYLLLESEYMTLDDNIKDIAQTGVDELISFFSFMDKLGYKFIISKSNSEGNEIPMYRKYKDIRIYKDYTDEQILSKAHSSTPVQYWIIESPDGLRTLVNVEDIFNIKNLIINYTKFQFEEFFRIPREVANYVKTASDKT